MERVLGEIGGEENYKTENTTTSKTKTKGIYTGDQIFENHRWFIRDVAVYTGYSKGTLYNLTSRNLIPHRKKRGKLYFVPVEIQNWIDEGELK